jgi:hypothetical protein
MTTITNSDDIIDIRSVIERYEELDEFVREPLSYKVPEALDEYVKLKNLLSELKGNGGDEQWRGDWYPITLIRDSYFKDYAMELAEDIHGQSLYTGEWPMRCIDWDKAARELRMDYSSVEFDGVTYWYR